jgi:hypothetical protein
MFSISICEVPSGKHRLSFENQYHFFTIGCIYPSQRHVLVKQEKNASLCQLSRPRCRGSKVTGSTCIFHDQAASEVQTAKAKPKNR